MLLSVQDMVSLIRRSVNVQIPAEPDEDGNVVTVPDKNYLTMTDDDIVLYLKLGVTRTFPDVDDLTDLPDGCQFALVLLAKIELYTALAVMKAEKVDMGVDNNTYLKQSQKFDHYMKLAEDAKGQYDDWLANEGEELLGVNTVNTYDVLLDKRHYSRRNIERQSAPKVKIRVLEVTSDSVFFSWSVTNMNHFHRFKVYVSSDTIIDLFREGSTYDKKVSPSAQCVKTTSDFRNTYHKIEGLSPDTDYHIAVVSVERNSVFGYAEKLFTTLEAPEDEEDTSTGEFNPDPDDPFDPEQPDLDDPDPEEPETDDTGGEVDG